MPHRKLPRTLSLSLLLLACVLSFGQLATTVGALPAKCDSETCDTSSDCGGGCFCNRPTGKCVVDELS